MGLYIAFFLQALAFSSFAFVRAIRSCSDQTPYASIIAMIPSECEHSLLPRFYFNDELSQGSPRLTSHIYDQKTSSYIITAYGYTNDGTPMNMRDHNKNFYPFGIAQGIGLETDTINQEIDQTSFIQLDFQQITGVSNVHVYNVHLLIGSAEGPYSLACVSRTSAGTTRNEGFALYGSNTPGERGVLIYSADSSMELVFFAIPNFGTYRYYSIQAKAYGTDGYAKMLLSGAILNCGDSPSPTFLPSQPPSISPTYVPSVIPSNKPSVAPVVPTFIPSLVPTFVPSLTPSNIPSSAPVTVVPVTFTPSYYPTTELTDVPSSVPSYIPSVESSYSPSVVPTSVPSSEPSIITQNNDQLVLGQRITAQCTASSTLDSSATTTYTATFQVQQSIETSSNGMTVDGSDAFTQTAECFVGTNVSIQSTTIVTRRRLINNLEDSTTKSNKMSTQSAVGQVTYDVLFLFTALSNQNITAEMLYAYYNLTNLILDNTQNNYYTVALYYYCSFYANCLNDPNVLTPTFSQPVLTSTVNDPVLSPTTVSAPSSGSTQKNAPYTDSINAIFASPAQATAFVVGIVLFITIAGYCFVYFFGNTCSLLRNKRKHKDPIVQDIWQIYPEDYHNDGSALKTSRPHNSSSDNSSNSDEDNDKDDNKSCNSNQSVVLNFSDTYDQHINASSISTACSSTINVSRNGNKNNNRSTINGSSKNSNKNNNNNVNDTDDAIIEIGRLSDEARESLRLAATLLEANKEFRYSVTPTKINNSKNNHPHSMNGSVGSVAKSVLI